MSPRHPLARHLESPTDEARILRMWAEIKDRRRRRPPVGRRLWAAAAAVVVVGLGLWGWSALESGTAGAIGLRTGALPEVIHAEAEEATVELDDGSRIDLSPDTRLETIQNDDGRFATLLSRGRARFSVKPGGPRRWVVESGLATVEVIGTIFTVDRSSGGVRVSVERGVVLVRGERVPERVARLTAGENLFVADEPRAEPRGGDEEPPPEVVQTAARTAVEPAETAEAPQEPVSAPSTESEPSAHGTPSAGTSPAAALGRPRTPDRPVRATPPTSREPADPVGRWLDDADRARRRGDIRAAVDLLERVAARGGDPRAALAAFTLGRLTMDGLHRPARARAAFERALSLGLPARLAEQARGRLEELNGHGTHGERPP